jgi:hypothetical protein
MGETMISVKRLHMLIRRQGKQQKLPRPTTDAVLQTRVTTRKPRILPKLSTSRNFHVLTNVT